MNTFATTLTAFQASHSNALQAALSAEALRERVPAAFAPAALMSARVRPTRSSRPSAY